MNRKTLFWSIFATLALATTLIQFVPSTPVVIPAQLPAAQRDDHRLLNFEGIANFRDLGGYQTTDGQQLKWGVLYRSATFAEASRADQQVLSQLGLHALVDFRSSAEREVEPNQLPDPAPFAVIEIPTMDGSASSVSTEIMQRLENGSFADFDPDAFMISTNRQFADTFTPQFSEFTQVLLAARGQPVVWHCSAGKDRTGYAAAIILRILGVPDEVILDDYALSKSYVLEARKRDLAILRLLKGDEAADKLTVLLGVEKPWLQAAFDEIDDVYGNFDNYVSQGLGLGPQEIEQLRAFLLE